ncbi:TorF family putative porin [Candidatus Methylopumilus planktonicus]|uniref:TorF family putative porin n=1 Tax=Candidatus Methylopumilus planktonicus TaxID=1581557 RepID=UPI003BEF460D
MRKSLITTVLLGALAVPSFVFAADSAPGVTVAYNVGLYSQYIFRGLTQTDRSPAVQGGVDLTHSSGFYLGAWASNISWLRDNNNAYATAPTAAYEKGGRIELDIYGGYRYTFGSGVGIDLGALQYMYPGSRSAGGEGNWASAYTTELYGALSYGWVQAKISSVVSDSAWTVGKYANAPASKNAQGTYYAELNATIPVSDLIGAKDGAASGITGIAHIARQEFNAGSGNDAYSYTDYKLGLQKSFSEGALNGVNVGGYWTYANTKDSVWTLENRNIGDSTGTVFVQKVF